MPKQQRRDDEHEDTDDQELHKRTANYSRSDVKG